MAIKGYFGSPGSGKTYEVVENVIVPAMAQGRRVVTNIAGLNGEAIAAYLVAKGNDVGKIGTIFNVLLNEDIAGKFAVIVGDGESAYLDESRSIVRGGDMVVLDEVWRVWEDGKKLHDDDRRFLRMHRHLMNAETRVTCDIAIISQTFTDVHRQVRSLIEERYEMSKHLALGMRNRYRVAIYTKGSRKPHMSLQKKYKQEIYDLYKSHSMGKVAGKEVEIDGRGNVLKGALFRVGIPLVLIVGLFGVWGMKRFFSGEAFGIEKNKTSQKIDGKGVADNKPVALLDASGVPVVAGAPVPAELETPERRVVGYFSNGKDAIIFIDVGGRSLMQRVADSKAVLIGQYVDVEVDGKRIGTWSGKEKKRDVQQ